MYKRLIGMGMLMACLCFVGCTDSQNVTLKNVSILESTEGLGTTKSTEIELETTQEKAKDTTQDTIKEPVQETTQATTVAKKNYPFISGCYVDKVRGDRWKVMLIGDMKMSEEDEKSLNRILNNYKGQISIKAVSLDGTKGITYNSEGEYFSACTVKAPYMLYCYRQMQQGNGSLKEEMTYNSSKHYHSGTGELKWNPNGTVYTLKEIMYYTLWKSDNVGYMMCLDRFGKDGYNEMMDEWGCPSLKIEDYAPWSFVARAEDLVIAWRHIYEFMQEQNEFSWAMYDSCTPCSYNFMGDAIPKFVISQKYGWGDDVYSDGGIVYSDNGNYIFAVYTNSSGEEYDKRVVNDAFRIIHKYMMPAQ